MYRKKEKGPCRNTILENWKTTYHYNINFALPAISFLFTRMTEESKHFPNEENVWILLCFSIAKNIPTSKEHHSMFRNEKLRYFTLGMFNFTLIHSEHCSEAFTSVASQE